MDVFHYTVDDEPQTTPEHVRTATQILQQDGIDPATHYLVQIKGKDQESYQGRAEEPIHMHEHMRFVSVSTGPTPVS